MTFDFAARLRQHLSSQSGNPLDPDSRACTEVGGTRVDGSTFWLQVHSGELNFQHMPEPGKDDLLARILHETGHRGEVTQEEGSFVNFEVFRMRGDALNVLLNRLSFDYFETNFFEDLEFSTKNI